jgi:hypothetical protein
MSSRYLCAMAGVVAMTMGASTRAQAQLFVPVSVATDGTFGNGASFGGVFSANGRFVAFASNATNLVASDANGTMDVFVRDLVGHTTERVSLTQAGAERVGDSGLRGVSLSADGTFVVFASRAPLVDTDTNSCAPFNCSDIYVRNRTTGAVERVSVASDGTQANGESGEPSISADGRYVVFTSSATNLVAGDQNGVDDVFLHDRVTHTTTRLSVSSTGGELMAPSSGAAISADGQTVLFRSIATGVVSDPDSLPCPATGTCSRAFLVDRSTGVIGRVPIPVAAIATPAGTSTHGTVVKATLTSDGRYVTLTVAPTDTIPSNSFFTSLLQNALVYDRLTQRMEWRSFVAPLGGAVYLNENGRYLTITGELLMSFAFPATPAQRIDRLGGVTVALPSTFEHLGSDEILPGQFSPDGLSVLFNVPDGLVAGDTNTLADLYLIQRDLDNDGMPDDWETIFGLNPSSAADAALDSDGDNVSNLQEYRDGTNPKGTFKRYFAEGAANSFFSTNFALFNPSDQPAVATLEFLGSNHQQHSQTVVLPAHIRKTVALTEGGSQPDNDFSTIVDADRQIVVDRTMYWDQSGYGSSAETAIAAPGTTWYLAEGSTGGAFDLFYLLQNPGDVDAAVTVNYLLPAPAAPIVKQYVVPAKSRKTIYVDLEGAALAGTDVSAKITSDQPILAERSMYFSTPTQPFAAGHEGAAVAAPALSWFFAEGATGTFFDEFLLLANAETTDASVQVTYLLPSGPPIVKTYTVPAQSRLTINVDFEDPALKDTPVSAIVESKNSVPIIAERAMWWPSPNWYEAHLSAGATTTGTVWALAEGTLAPGTETYVLIANTSSTAGTADVTLYFSPDGYTQTKTFALPANSRVNVQVSQEFPGAPKVAFGTIITSSGPPIVVERAIYTNANGQVWAAGSDALGTKLQ